MNNLSLLWSGIILAEYVGISLSKPICNAKVHEPVPEFRVLDLSQGMETGKILGEIKAEKTSFLKSLTQLWRNTAEELKKNKNIYIYVQFDYKMQKKEYWVFKNF